MRRVDHPSPSGLASPPRSLRRNLAWTLAGNVTYAATQWGVLVVLAKLGSPQILGRFALGLAVCAPVQILANLDLRSVQSTDARREFRFQEYLRLRWATSLGALLVIGAVVVVAGYPRPTALVVLAVAIAKTVESFCDLHYGRFQQHERMDLVARSMITRGLLSLAAVMVGLAVLDDLLSATLLLAACWALVLLVHDVPASRALAPPAPEGSRGWAVVGRLAVLSLPLGLASTITTLNANVPRYAVERVLGEAALGVYAAMAYFIVGAATVANAVGHTTSPRLAGLYTRGDGGGFRRLLGRIVLLCLAGTVLGALVAIAGGSHLLAVLYTAEYARHERVFSILIAAAGIGLLSGFLTHAVVAARRFAALVPSTLAVLLLTVGAAVVLVPRAGLEGAAWTTLMFYAAQAAWKGALVLSSLRQLRAGQPRVAGI